LRKELGFRLSPAADPRADLNAPLDAAFRPIQSECDFDANFRSMDQRTLRRVVTLARLLSYRKAAEQLAISQSVLTRSIQEVERRANVRLFDRDRGGVRVTPVGRAFVERAASLLRETEDLERMLKRAAGGSDGNVSVGLAPLVAPALLPSVLGEFEPGPELKAYVAIRPAAALVPLLVNEDVELVVCGQGVIDPRLPLRSSFLGEYPVSLLVRAGHPLLGAEPRATDGEFPVVAGAMFDNAAAFPQYYWDLLQGARRAIVEDYGFMARLTEDSDAIWVSSTFAAIDAVTSGRLVEIPPPASESPVRLRLMVYSLDRRSRSPTALKLEERLRLALQALWRRLADAPVDGAASGGHGGELDSA
jgi:DNA-binding transcriptional LysR family regulator